MALEMYRGEKMFRKEEEVCDYISIFLILEYVGNSDHTQKY